MRFFNDDAKIKVGGRFAAKLSIDELKSIIEDKYFNKLEKEGCFEYEDFSDDDRSYKMSRIIEALICEDPIIQKDIKYSFDTENLLTCKEEVDDDDMIVDYHTLDNGLTFLGIFGGGDWEIGMYSIIYYDGKNLRLFQPTRGNAVNRKTKMAFGNDDSDPEVISNYGTVSNPDETWVPDDLDALYNFDAMLEEIKARIVVR